MKILPIFKKIQMTGAVAILALGVSSQAFAFPIFTVDPDAAFGATGGYHPGPFQSDFITGNSSTLVSTPGSPNQHGEGWVNFSSFVNAGTPVLGSDSGLNTNWQMWAEITSDLTRVSGSYSQPGSTYDVTALHADLWVDPSIDTPTIFTSATDSGGAATVNHGTDSFMIATADLIIGVASVNDLGGTGINSTNSFNLLDPLGASLFTAPFPFYNIQFDEVKLPPAKPEAYFC